MSTRRAIVIGGLLALVALAFLLHPRGSAPPTRPNSAPPAAVVAPPPPRAHHARPPRRVVHDPNDTDPRVRARAREELERQPALQQLPYDGEGVSIDLTGGLSQGKTELVVSYRGTLAGARRAYRGFLATYHDSGETYVVRYKRAAPSRGMTG